MNNNSVTISCVVLLLTILQCSVAFLNQPPPRGRRFGGGGPPRSHGNRHTSYNDDDPSSSSLYVYTDQNETQYYYHDLCSNVQEESKNHSNDTHTTTAAAAVVVEEEETTTTSDDDPVLVVVPRGGGDIVKGSKATLSSTADWWKNAFGSVSRSVSAPVRAVGGKVSEALKSKEQKQEEVLVNQLRTIPVRTVSVPNTTVLPSDVIQLAAQRAGVIGNPLRTDRIQELASFLKQWYTRRGYVLHGVTGATLLADSATAEIAVEEPKVSESPVAMTFCKEMVVDQETGKLLTFRQYKELHAKRKTFGHEKITRQDTNRTFVETQGRTNPTRIASALGLFPGAAFCWDSNRWNRVANSGIFSQVLQAGPQRMKDGSVQLQVIATEAKNRHLEYGITRSMYTGGWEGELNFEHGNVLGGAETLGVVVRRGAKDAEPSVKLQFRDDKFGMEGGYGVDVFSDFIGDDQQLHSGEQTEEDSSSPKEDEAAVVGDYNSDNLLSRKGLSFRFRNPIDQKIITHSSVSTCLERTTTQTGLHEMIGSGTLGVGPFTKELPYDARSNVDATITAGTRIPDTHSSSNIDGELSSSSSSSSSSSGLILLPYSSMCVTTKQVLPLASNDNNNNKRSLFLALRHAFCTSSHNLPRHEGNALGNAATIRGGRAQGRIKTSVVGTTEIRIPIELPTKKVNQDASVVLFCDYTCAIKSSDSATLSTQSSVGVGLRKSFQGIPLKFDVCYSNEREFKSMLSLGKDFDV